MKRLLFLCFLLVLLEPPAALANPMILGDEDFARGRYGLAVILGLEAALASYLLAQKGLRFLPLFIAALAINALSFFLFSKHLIVYNPYAGMYYKGLVLPVELAIVLLEGSLYWALSRLSALYHPDKEPLSARNVFLVSLLTNALSFFATPIWHIAVELSYQPWYERLKTRE